MSSLASLPFFERLAGARSVLVMGAGGGFDVYAGVPLLLALERAGARVHLGNVSFTNLAEVSGRRIGTAVEVTSASSGTVRYFPELHLVRALEAHGHGRPVFAFARSGVRPLRATLETLCTELAIDALVLVDGGSDSVLFGDEAGLGTPVEDMTSIAAAAALPMERKLLASIGFGVDAFHGVCHAHVLENVAALTRAGAFLGAFSLLPQMEEFRLYRACVDAASRSMAGHESIVNTSIVSAVEGAYGDVHRTRRTQGSELWINPLMALYFGFELGALARSVAYLPTIADTDTPFEVASRIEAHQNATPRLRERRTIPV